jgi:hypothetical protein
MGTRGVPAQHGGFETAVEEIGRRLVQRGYEVTVYCRNPGQQFTQYEGMRLINVPAIRNRFAETLSHTALSSAHAITKYRPVKALHILRLARRHVGKVNPSNRANARYRDVHLLEVKMVTYCLSGHGILEGFQENAAIIGAQDGRELPHTFKREPLPAPVNTSKVKERVRMN